MSQQQTTEKINLIVTWVARFLVILSIIAFFIPFCTVSCSGYKVEEVSMKDIAFGKEIEVSTYGYSETHRAEGKTVYVLCLALPIVAFCLSFLKEQIIGAIGNLIEGGAILLLCGRAARIVEEACIEYGCTLKKTTGYVLYQVHGWLMIVLGAIGIILFVLSQVELHSNSSMKVQPNSNIHWLSDQNGPKTMSKSSTMLPNGAFFEKSEKKVCTSCGHINEKEYDFCVICGRKLPAENSIKICTGCGKRNESTNAYCVNCGRKLL